MSALPVSECDEIAQQIKLCTKEFGLISQVLGKCKNLTEAFSECKYKEVPMIQFHLALCKY